MKQNAHCTRIWLWLNKLTMHQISWLQSGTPHWKQQILWHWDLIGQRYYGPAGPVFLCISSQKWVLDHTPVSHHGQMCYQNPSDVRLSGSFLWTVEVIMVIHLLKRTRFLVKQNNQEWHASDNSSTHQVWLHVTNTPVYMSSILFSHQHEPMKSLMSSIPAARQGLKAAMSGQ